MRWLLISLLFVFACPANATTRFVNYTCANNGNGTASTCAASPGGVGAYNLGQNCNAASSAGDTCLFEDNSSSGTRNEAITPSVSGTGSLGVCSACITFKPDVGASVTTGPWNVAADYVVISGFTITDPTFTIGNAGVYIHSGHTGVQVLNNTVTQVGRALSCAVTSFTGTSGTLTFSCTNTFTASLLVVLSGFTAPNTALNGQTITVTSPTGSQFQATVTGSGYSSGTGTAAQASSGYPCISMQDGPSHYVTIKGNTLSWCSSLSSQGGSTPGGNSHMGAAIVSVGDHIFVSGNDATKIEECLQIGGNSTFLAFVGNTCHDVNLAVDAAGCITSPNNCNTHLDYLISTGGGNTNILMEGNTAKSWLGVNGEHFHFFSSSTSANNYFITRFEKGYKGGNDFLGNNFGTSAAFAANFWKEYNSTFIIPAYESGASGLIIAGCNPPTGGGTNGSFINNLFYNIPIILGTPNTTYYTWTGTCAATFTGGHNLAFDTVCSPSTLNNCTAGQMRTDPGNIWNDPKLVATDGSSFALQGGSPAINAATNLTTTTNSGASSTTLTVADATYFQDGMGMSGMGVQPDCLRIGASTISCVSSINYSTNTITLASPVSWSNGANVYLYSKSDGTQVLFDANGEIGAVPASTPIVTFTPSAGNIGQVPVGLTSNPVSVTLQNIGAGTLTNTSITLSNALFSIVNNTCGSPATITNLIPGTGFTLGAGANCTFGVTASPTATGAITANAVFTENTATGSDTLVLKANGTGPPAPNITTAENIGGTHESRNMATVVEWSNWRLYRLGGERDYASHR